MDLTARTSDKDEKPSPFLRLPPEIRNKIYQMALVKVPDEHWWGMREVETLAPPALAQVNRQIRAETLPIHYGENEFRIQMPSDEDDDDDDWVSFIHMCSCMAATGGLKFIKKLSVDYSEPVWEDMKNYLLSFDLLGDDDQEHRNDSRIGTDTLDWNDGRAVREAFNDTIERSVGKSVDLDDMKSRVPIARVGDVLFALAKYCELANRYVELGWDYGN